MKSIKIIFTLLVLSLTSLSAQDKWYVTITMPTQMTTAGYDALFDKIGAQGLANCYSEYHAAGSGMPAGFMGFTTFSSKAQLDARLSTLKPFLGSTTPVPYEVYKVIAGKNATALTDKTIIVHFDVKGQTQAQYDKIITDLDKAGQLNNPARMYHVAYKTPEGIKIVDVWTDAESFGAAGQKLMPIIQAAGVMPPPPMIYAAHAIRMPSQADRNKDVVRNFYNWYGVQHNVEACESLFDATTFKIEEPSMGKLDLNGYKQLGMDFLKAFPDLKINILSIVAEGDQVAVLSRATGTQKAPIMGIPATGKMIDYMGTEFWTLKNGKIVWCKALNDNLTFMQQLGVIPPNGK